MLTSDLYQPRDPNSDIVKLLNQQKAPSAWYAPDTSSASESTVLISGTLILEPALTQPRVEFDEEMTRFSFKVSTEPVGQDFIDEVFDDVFARSSVPFKRVFEDEQGE